MSDTPAAPERLDFRRILPIFVIVFVDLMGLTVIIPMLPLYATAFGANAFVIGALNASYPLMQFIGGPLLGSLSDRYGRKPILLLSQIGTFTGFIILAFAGSLPMLFLSRMVDGLSGGNIATAQAALSDSTTEKTRAQGLGLIGAAFGLGFVIGPVITAVSLAVSANDYRLPALIAAGFSLASILLTTFVFRETLPPERRGMTSGRAGLTELPTRMAAALRSPDIGILIALIFSQQVVFSAFQTLFAPLTLSRLGIGGSGNALFFTVSGLTLATVQGGLIGRLSRRFGERRLLITGLALLGVGLLVLSLVPTQPPPTYDRAALLDELHASEAPAAGGEGIALDLPIEPPPESAPRGWLGVALVLAGILPVSAGVGLLLPSINSLITKRTDARAVGGTLGISAAFTSAANIVGPLIGGGLFEALGAAAPFLAGALIVFALSLLARARV
jgi:MFS family permease